MILSLSAKDLESLFHGVLENYFGRSLSVRHPPLNSPIYGTSRVKKFYCAQTVPIVCQQFSIYSDRNEALFLLVCLTYLAYF